MLEGYYVIMMGQAYSNWRLLMYVIFHRLHAINSLRVVFHVLSYIFPVFLFINYETRQLAVGIPDECRNITCYIKCGKDDPSPKSADQ